MALNVNINIQAESLRSADNQTRQAQRHDLSRKTDQARITGKALELSSPAYGQNAKNPFNQTRSSQRQNNGKPTEQAAIISPSPSYAKPAGEPQRISQELSARRRGGARIPRRNIPYIFRSYYGSNRPPGFNTFPGTRGGTVRFINQNNLYKEYDYPVVNRSMIGEYQGSSPENYESYIATHIKLDRYRITMTQPEEGEPIYRYFQAQLVRVKTDSYLDIKGNTIEESFPINKWIRQSDQMEFSGITELPVGPLIFSFNGLIRPFFAQETPTTAVMSFTYGITGEVFPPPGLEGDNWDASSTDWIESGGKVTPVRTGILLYPFFEDVLLPAGGDGLVYSEISQSHGISRYWAKTIPQADQSAFNTTETGPQISTPETIRGFFVNSAGFRDLDIPVTLRDFLKSTIPQNVVITSTGITHDPWAYFPSGFNQGRSYAVFPEDDSVIYYPEDFTLGKWLYGDPANTDNYYDPFLVTNSLLQAISGVQITSRPVEFVFETFDPPSAVQDVDKSIDFRASIEQFSDSGSPQGCRNALIALGFSLEQIT